MFRKLWHVEKPLSGSPLSHQGTGSHAHVFRFGRGGGLTLIASHVVSQSLTTFVFFPLHFETLAGFFGDMFVSVVLANLLSPSFPPSPCAFPKLI